MAAVAQPANGVASFRLRLAVDKSVLVEHFAAARPSATAATTLIRGLARLVDATLGELWVATMMPARAALVAVGGYGRGELFPFSDVDVLVLLPDELAAEQVRPAVERFITACWDIGLEIGSSVRNTDECAAESKRDVTVQTALLESRLVCGPRRLFVALHKRLAADREPRAFLRAKTLEMQQRHIKYEDTPYSLEPNCKESPGGLRDLQLLIWVARAAGLGRTWGELAANGIVTPFEAQQLQHNEGLLRLIRARLHMIAGRREDRLVFDLQTAVATSSGPVGTQGPARVRSADAALLLGRQGRGPAQPDRAAEHRGPRRRPRSPGHAPDQRALLRPRRHARSGQRRPVPARSARDPRNLSGLPANRGHQGAVGTHAARAVQRAPPDGRCVSQRPGQPRRFMRDPAAAQRPYPRPAADEPDLGARAATCGSFAASSVRCSTTCSTSTPWTSTS